LCHVLERDVEDGEESMMWTVSDVMTKDPVTVGPATSFKSCANLMRIHEVSAIPVVAPRAGLLGIISESDLLAKEAERPNKRPDQRSSVKAKAMTAAELMTTQLVTTTPGAPLNTAASLMFQHHVRALPVVDSEHRLVGMVSRAQILKVFLRSDESIRREVAKSLSDIPSMNRAGSDVEVEEGVVHLYCVDQEGSLEEVVGRRLMGIPGVVGVKSHLKRTIKSDAAELAPASNRRG
jgi:CBS-domain-containing membrane protein